MKKNFLVAKFVVTGFLLLCVFYKARAANIVSVCSPGAPPQSAKINLNAVVEAKLDVSATSSYHSYRIAASLPKTVIPDVHLNQHLDVSLPVVRRTQDKARVTNISNRKLQLLLSNQVQQLEGQVLTVQVPLKREGLYLLPPQSVYSPRGIDPRVFIVTNSKASTVPVEVIQVMDSGQVLVSSSELRNSKVICRGLDNLIAGESVQVIESMGERL